MFLSPTLKKLQKIAEIRSQNPKKNLMMHIRYFMEVEMGMRIKLSLRQSL